MGRCRRRSGAGFKSAARMEALAAAAPVAPRVDEARLGQVVRDAVEDVLAQSNAGVENGKWTEAVQALQRRVDEQFEAVAIQVGSRGERSALTTGGQHQGEHGDAIWRAYR